MFDVLIIGGGLSGLINARLLALEGLSVAMVEKNRYPFHRVCGEYISNEVKPFLERIDCFPSHLNPTSIHRLEVTAPSGFKLQAPLPMGAFGISRYAFDDFLKQQAQQAGATIIEGEQIYTSQQQGKTFLSKSLSHKEYNSKLVIGAQGKRSMLDKDLKRDFMSERSPYIGVKYHIRTQQAEDLIGLHNFQDGYCGISKIENDTYCLCYLTTRAHLKKYGTIEAMEQSVLFKNPYLRSIFTESTFLYDAPEVINEISFAPKKLSEHQLLFCGDAAGMIAPLCGNGMAMAIHSAKLLSEHILSHRDTLDPQLILSGYKKQWDEQFKQRLWIGRTIQRLFGQNKMTEMSLRTLSLSPWLLNKIIEKTHGGII